MCVRKAFLKTIIPLFSVLFPLFPFPTLQTSASTVVEDRRPGQISLQLEQTKKLMRRREDEETKKLRRREGEASGSGCATWKKKKKREERRKKKKKGKGIGLGFDKT